MAIYISHQHTQQITMLSAPHLLSPPALMGPFLAGYEDVLSILFVDFANVIEEWCVMSHLKAVEFGHLDHQLEPVIDVASGLNDGLSSSAVPNFAIWVGERSSKAVGSRVETS